MYTTYFGFKEEPFSLTPTSRLFYSNPVYEGAYAKLLQGIRERQGFIILTGEVGTGKTTLIQRLITNLQGDPSVSLSFSYYSTLTFEELISFVCRDLGVTRKNIGELQAFSEYLQVRSQSGTTTTLVIDEAQDIEEDVLEHLFRLSESPHVSGKLLQVILVGQHPELDKKISHPRFDSFRQKVLFRCQLEHLKPEEVREFIYHRLRLVGYDREDLFNPEVIRLITEYSLGIPRLVNLICDNALRAIYEASRKTVACDDIEGVVAGLRLRGSPTPQPTEATDTTVEVEQLAASTPRVDVTESRPAGGMFQSLLWGGAGFLLVLLGFFAFSQWGQSPQAPALQSLTATNQQSQLAATSSVQQPGAVTGQSMPVALAIPTLNANDPRVMQGKAIISKLSNQYPHLRPIAWGLATPTPAIALIIPENAWRQLSKEDQVNLTLYLESLIPEVRAAPDPYVEEFRTAPAYDTFRTKLTALCADCWILGTGHATSGSEKVVFEKIIVQGNSLWENAPQEGRGLNARAFREASKTN